MNLHTKEIETIWTRIYYKDKILTYEITFELKTKDYISHCIYQDYQDYRKELDKMIDAKDNNEVILIGAPSYQRAAQ